jgi:hypothetical protein
MGFLSRKIENLPIFGHQNTIDSKVRQISLPVCKNQVAIYQLNMFGVAVLGSIPRWTSLYRTESKYPAKPGKMMWTKTSISDGTSVPVLEYSMNTKIQIHRCIPCTRHEPISGGMSNCKLVYL